MSDTEIVLGPVSEDRVTYFTRSWDARIRDTIPEWVERSYDRNDPALLALHKKIDARKNEIKTAMEQMLRDGG